MKIILTISFLLIQLLGLSQQKDSLSNNITFVTKFKIDESAGKGDVYRLNNYVVHINWRKAQRLNGKTLKISGEVTLIKRLPKIEDKKSPQIQGYSGDTKHIFNPKIKIIKE